jgi:hypothetical protein
MATRTELYSRPRMKYCGIRGHPTSISCPAAAMPPANTQPKWGKEAEEGPEVPFRSKSIVDR